MEHAMEIGDYKKLRCINLGVFLKRKKYTSIKMFIIYWNESSNPWVRNKKMLSEPSDYKRFCSCVLFCFLILFAVEMLLKCWRQTLNKIYMAFAYDFFGDYSFTFLYLRTLILTLPWDTLRTATPSSCLAWLRSLPFTDIIWSPLAMWPSTSAAPPKT